MLPYLVCRQDQQGSTNNTASLPRTFLAHLHDMDKSLKKNSMKEEGVVIEESVSHER